MNTVERELLKEALDEIGLSGAEKTFYISVLRSKEPLVSEVVKLSGLQRPTAYQALKRLKHRGLLSTDTKTYKQRVTVVSPTKLIQLVSKKQRDIRKLELRLKDHQESLQQLFRTSFSPPVVQQFEGPEKYRELAELTLACKSKVIRYLGNIDDYLRVVGEEYDRNEYLPERLAYGIRLRVICNETSYLAKVGMRDSEELRERKVIPRTKFAIDSSMAIFDHTVIFYSKPEEQLALMITSSSTVSLLKNLFDELWKKKI